MFTTNDLADMQNEILFTLTDLCTLTRKTKVSDNMGGETWTYQAYQANIPCKIAPAGVPFGREERSIADTLVAAKDWIIHLPIAGLLLKPSEYSPPISAANFTMPQIVYTDRIVHSSGRRFEVTNIGDPRTISLEQRLSCVEIV